MWPFNRKSAAKPAEKFVIPQDVLTSAKLAAVQGLREGSARLSRESSTLFGGLRSDLPFEGFPQESSRQIIRSLRALSQKDEDVSGTKRDFIVLANPGHSVEFVGKTSDVKRAIKEYALWAEGIFRVGGGLDAWANNQISELLVTGASSCEWYPTPDRTGVKDVAIVPAETMRIHRDPEFDVWHFRQTTVSAQDIELDPTTYCYIPLLTDGEKPYGIPMFLGGLSALARKHGLLKSLDRILDLMGKAVLMKASIPKLQESDLLSLNEGRPISPEEFVKAERQYYAEIGAMIMDRAERGLIVVPEGVEIELTPLANAAEGYPAIFKHTDRLVFTGLRTLGFLRSSTDSITEALAKVQYPILEAEAQNIAMILSRQHEFGINLHMRLRGISVKAKVRYHKPPSAYALDGANVENVRAKTDAMLFQTFGFQATQQRIEQNWGFKLTESSIPQTPGLTGLGPVPQNTAPSQPADTSVPGAEVYSRSVLLYNEGTYKVSSFEEI